MDEYKEVNEEFLERIEELDLRIDIEMMQNREIHLLNIIRSCRNKLADTYNCIGDEN